MADMIILEPSDELVFDGPFNRQIVNNLIITNPHKDQAIFYKIKTTAPKLYCVRPNVGRLSPMETRAIQIFLQPFKHDEEIKRHKFLVQATPALPNVENILEFWKNADLSNIWDVRLKCVLRLPDGDGFNPKVINGSPASAESEADACGYNEFKNPCELPKESPKPDIEKINKVQDDAEANNLRQQIQALQKEKFGLKDEIEKLREKQKDGIEMRPSKDNREKQLRVVQKGRRSYFYLVATVISFVAAMFGVYVGKNMA